MVANPPTRRSIGDVRRLGAVDGAELTGHLRAGAEWNVFMLGWLESRGVEPSDSGGRFLFVGARVEGKLEAAALLAGTELCCLSRSSIVAATSLGRRLADRLGVIHTIVGPEASVVAFLEGASTGTHRAALSHQQSLLRLRGSAPPVGAREPLLMRASEHDVPDLSRASIEMHSEETDRALTRRERELFERGVASKVAAGRVWRLRDPATNRLLFKASVSALMNDLAQVEGVWVAPKSRGRGIGSRAMGELCDRLMVGGRAVCLYANIDNEPALRMYDGLGFEALGSYMTVYWRFPHA